MEFHKFHRGHHKHKLCEFRNADLKNLTWQRLLEQINSHNESLNPNMDDLISWYNNVWTEFGQVKKAMVTSGGGGLLEEMTERQEWLWTRCQFLSNYINTNMEGNQVRLVSTHFFLLTFFD